MISFGSSRANRPSALLFVSLVVTSSRAVQTTQRCSPLALKCKRSHHRATMASNSVYGGGSGVTVEGTGEATAAVVFLHGLGDTGAGWAPAFPLRGAPHVRAILPTADVQPVSLNGGFPMPAWFDLYGLDETSRDDTEGISRAVARVGRVVDQLTNSGIRSDRIVLAGFSQGGAVALTAGLQSPNRLAGIVALSTWLPMRKEYPSVLGPNALDVPVFCAHGQSDPVVPLHFGEISANMLKEMGVPASFHSYAGLQHSASEEELKDVAEFVKKVLPPL